MNDDWGLTDEEIDEQLHLDELEKQLEDSEQD